MQVAVRLQGGGKGAKVSIRVGDMFPGKVRLRHFGWEGRARSTSEEGMEGGKEALELTTGGRSSGPGGLVVDEASWASPREGSPSTRQHAQHTVDIPTGGAQSRNVTPGACTACSHICPPVHPSRTFPGGLPVATVAQAPGNSCRTPQQPHTFSEEPTGKQHVCPEDSAGGGGGGGGALVGGAGKPVVIIISVVIHMDGQQPLCQS